MEGFEQEPRLRVATGERPRPAATTSEQPRSALTTGEQPSAEGGGAVEGVLDEFATRPELFVAAAFAGGILVAQLLKLLRR